MAGLEDRIRRLEAARGVEREADEAERRRRRIFDRMYHVVESTRRERAGLEPEPLPEDLRETKDDVLHTLRTTIPHYRQYGGWRYGDGKAFMDAWEDRELEKLSELQKGDEE